MRMNEVMVGCNTGGPIEIGSWPDKTGWSDRYTWTFGACFIERQEFAPAMQLAMLFIDFQQAVVDYRIPASEAHREFMKIDEYRWHISPDSKGSEEPPAEWVKAVQGAR